MNPRFVSCSLVVFSALAALSGCGGSNAKSTASTANGDPASLGCANPVEVNAVPSDWKAVEGRELISGTSGTWRLTKVILHSAMPAKDGRFISASTTTIVGNDPIQTVDCKDLLGSGAMSITIQPWETISDADGSIDTRRNIRFGITADETGYKSATTERVSTTAKFGVETLDSRRQEADAKAVGVVYQTKTYRISPSEMEIRMHAEVPNQNGNGGTLYFNSAMRYELRNP
ncbi:MAG: hypothetical protein JST04_01250 [Bdellovibrionales bacterium]|nr:hypothetical protein [Bdellovibrionales bacterium]